MDDGMRDLRSGYLNVCPVALERVGDQQSIVRDTVVVDRGRGRFRNLPSPGSGNRVCLPLQTFLDVLGGERRPDPNCVGDREREVGTGSERACTRAAPILAIVILLSAFRLTRSCSRPSCPSQRSIMSLHTPCLRWIPSWSSF